MKRNFIFSAVVIIGLICALTIRSSAEFHSISTEEIASPNPEIRTAAQNWSATGPKATPRNVLNVETASGFFTDVPQDSYYFDAVKWAVERGVTNGTSATTFSSGNTCTRGQVVTFLWRNAGQPEPSAARNPFADITEDNYYYKAVLWAVEQGVTNGTSATTFSPNQSCSYAHVVTFLWRLSNPGDADRGEGAWYTAPAAWANYSGLLTGTNFIPNQPCPRSDIVTYLYRNRPDRIDVSMTVIDEDPAFAVIQARDFVGNVVWQHTTGQHFLNELTTIQEIGVFGDQYLYVEDGSVMSLDLHTGALRWKNDDFVGGVSDYCTGKNGDLYLCSAEGYAFFGVDMSGNTLGGVVHFSQSQDEGPYFIWPYEIRRVDENHMSVWLVGSGQYYENKKAFLVDLRDFSYEGPFDENDSRVTPRIGPFLSGFWIRDEPRVSGIDVEQIGDLYLFNLSWKSGYHRSFCGRWENGEIRYTNGLYSHRDWEFEWGQTGSVRLSGNTLIWTDAESIYSGPVEYVRYYEAPTED